LNRWLTFRYVPGELNPGASLVAPNQVRIELSDHFEPIEQQPADRIGEVVPPFAEGTWHAVSSSAIA